MPNTARNSVRTIVNDASIAYKSDDIVWPEVFKRLPLKTVKQKIWIYNKGDQFRIPDDNQIYRAEETESWRQKRKGSFVNVDAIEKSIGTSITDQELRNEGLQPGSVPPQDMQMEAAENNADIIDRWTESKVASTIITQTWADGVSGGKDADGLWGETGSTNTFILDVLAALDAMRKLGIAPMNMRLLLDYTTMRYLKRVDEVKDNIKYATPGGSRPDQITPELLAQSLGINKVVVAGSIKSTANEKADGTDFTGANIWDTANSKGIGFLYHYPASIGRKMTAPALVPTLPQLNNQIRDTRSWYEPNKKRWVYETTEENEVKITDLSAGYLWKDTHTT